MQFITRPLEKWPRPTTKARRRSPYSVGYTATLHDLEREILAIGGKHDVVIQIDLPESGIRRDGLPYSDSRPNTPRVAVAFTCKHGPLTYYCDRFWDWQSNIRAIALGLQRLRLVEETGIVSRGEQYTGFKQLPAAIELGPTMTVEEAAEFVAGLSGLTGGGPTVLSAHVYYSHAYRAAVKRAHPDAGGTGEQWDKLQAASKLLDVYFSAVAV